MNTPGTTQHHILVVDDEPLVRQTVHMVLELDGHHVAEADGGPQALTQFEPGKFDLVVTDHCMPNMTGNQLAAAIKQLSPHQPIILLTAYAEKVTAPGQPPLAADLLIGKPFDIGALRDAVSKCMPV